jgi:flagellar FliL protein
MAAKTDPKEAKESAPAEAAAPAAAGGGLKSWLPVIAALVLAPAISFAVAEFVLLPRLTAKLNAAPVAPAAEGEHAAPEAAAPDAPAHGGKKGEKEAGSGPGTYEFANVVVNLAGTMGTRYLKTSFVVTGKNVKPAFESDKARLTDVTLSVLSSLTLADLEEAGAKNILREKLVGAYNQTLGKHLVDQVYFSDFVIQ